MRILFPLLALLPSLAFAAEQSRQVEPFQSIKSEGVYTLDVTVGPQPSLRIEGDDESLARMEAWVEKDELHIRLKNGSAHFSWGARNVSKLHVYVTTPSLRAFSSEGVGENLLHGLKGDDFNLRYSGVGQLVADGAIKQLTVNASGTGGVDLKALKTVDTTISLGGVGSATVYATDSIVASVSGIGSLTYYGHPAKFSKSVSGIGSVSAGD